MRSPLLVIAVLAAATLAVPAHAGAPIGADDPGFGTDGRIVWTEALGSNDDLAVLSGGTFLVHLAAQPLEPDGTAHDILMRYLADGTADPSFGVGGTADINVPGIALDEMTVAPGGKILLAGSTTSGAGDTDLAVVRLRADGTFDPLFGTGGVVRTDVAGAADAGCTVAVQPDGKVLVGGRSFVASAGEDRVVVARYRPDGTVNKAFGDSGVARLPIDGSACDLSVRTDGRIVAGGITSTGACPVGMLTANGKADTSFSGNGVATFHGADLPGQVTNCETTLDASGRIVLATRGMRVRRVTAAGTTDATFGDHGVATIDFFDSDTYTGDVLVDGDGDIVVAGAAAGVRRGDDMALARLDHTGTPDPSFGVDGVVVTDASRGGAGRQLDDRADHVALEGGDLLSLGTVTRRVDPATPVPAVLRFGPLALDTVPPLTDIDRPRAGKTYGQLGLLALRGTALDVHSEVARVEVAVRESLEGGRCAWLGRRGGWVARPCGGRLWLAAKGTVFWVYNLKHKLQESRGSKVLRYRAFARAVDRAGNVEHVFRNGRNSNTFEIQN
jgi:uncharacterized delta-60 repeat protein